MPGGDPIATELVKVDADHPRAEAIARAAAVLRRGGLVAFPTETVYGLGAMGLDAKAVARIYQAKGRPAVNPLILHVVDATGARKLVSEWPDRAERLAQAFWPGPLTLVLPRNERVPDIVTADGPTVAVRAPPHPVARALLAETGMPLAAPSANLSSRVSATTAAHVMGQLAGRIEMVLDAGSTTAGLESTVVDLSGARVTLLRPGPITLAQVAAVLDEPVIESGRSISTAALRSPGLLARHYAPQTVLELSGDAVRRAAELIEAGLRVGLMTLGTEAFAPPANLLLYVMPEGAADYAARLYAVLHELDAAGLDRIVVQLPPKTPEWLAIHDRLRRAATTE